MKRKTWAAWAAVCVGALQSVSAMAQDARSDGAELDLAGVTVGMPLGKALDALGASRPEWKSSIDSRREELMKDCLDPQGRGVASLALSKAADRVGSSQGDASAEASIKCQEAGHGGLEVAEMWLRVDLGAEREVAPMSRSEVMGALARRHGGAMLRDLGQDVGFYALWRTEADASGHVGNLSAAMMSEGPSAPTVLSMHLWSTLPGYRGWTAPVRSRALSGFDSPY